MGKIAKQTLSYDPVPQQTTISLLRGFLTISGKYKSEKIRSEGTVVGNRETSNTDYDIYPMGASFYGQIITKYNIFLRMIKVQYSEQFIRGFLFSIFRVMSDYACARNNAFITHKNRKKCSLLWGHS